MKENKWLHNTNEELWMNCEDYETKEQVIKAGREEYKGDREGFYIGQVRNVDFALNINVDDVLENIHQSVYDEVGEVAEDYLNHVKKEHLSDLESELNAVVHKWMKQYNYEPTFFKVDNIESVKTDD